MVLLDVEPPEGEALPTLPGEPAGEVGYFATGAAAGALAGEEFSSGVSPDVAGAEAASEALPGELSDSGGEAASGASPGGLPDSGAEVGVSSLGPLAGALSGLSGTAPEAGAAVGATLAAAGVF